MNGSGWQCFSPEPVGAPGGIRTPNLLIRSQMLYPLSYGRVGGIHRGESPVFDFS